MLQKTYIIYMFDKDMTINIHPQGKESSISIDNRIWIYKNYITSLEINNYPYIPLLERVESLTLCGDLQDLKIHPEFPKSLKIIEMSPKHIPHLDILNNISSNEGIYLKILRDDGTYWYPPKIRIPKGGLKKCVRLKVDNMKLLTKVIYPELKDNNIPIEIVVYGNDILEKKYLDKIIKYKLNVVKIIRKNIGVADFAIHNEFLDVSLFKNITSLKTIEYYDGKLSNIKEINLMPHLKTLNVMVISEDINKFNYLESLEIINFQPKNKEIYIKSKNLKCITITINESIKINDILDIINKNKSIKNLTLKLYDSEWINSHLYPLLGTKSKNVNKINLSFNIPCPDKSNKKIYNACYLSYFKSINIYGRIEKRFPGNNPFIFKRIDKFKDIDIFI